MRSGIGGPKAIGHHEEVGLKEKNVALVRGRADAGGRRGIDEAQAIGGVAHQAVQDGAERLGRPQAHVLVGLVDDQLHGGQL